MKIFMKHDDVHHGLFVWGTTPEGIKYRIRESKIQAALDPDPISLEERLAQWRIKFNRMYQDSSAVVEFQGTYDRDEKKLTLRANA